ncbi:uncharacterized protein LOC117598814 [Pangasianodon hypophthalmus]|uniref:uncharacterized protein LOC117598814 n=1 Tax=Pangasianodon hypophthalmus TaxID=310915 RepID=UPI002308242F|nr:uncharacterized protein LOC117598814 [Pangasianodon hypophthalmus]
MDRSDSQVFLNDVRVDLCHCDDAFDYWGKGTTVTVTSAVQGPPQSLFPVWQCGSASDGLITLGCVTRDLASADGLIFKWADEKGSALTDVVQYPAVRGSGGFTSVSQVRVKASDWTQSKKFTCRVENAKGYKEALLQKKVVPELPASLLLTTPTQTEIDNGTATFICLATQFSPKTHTFKWTRGSTELGNKVKHTILSPDKDAYTAVSILEISANEWTGSSSPVKCEFHQKKWTAAKEAIYVSVDSKPPQVKIIPPCARDMLLKRAGQLECRAEGQVGFKGIKWLIGGTEISSLAEKDVSTETTVTLTTPISFDEWSDGTKFTCEVEHSAFALQYETVDYQRVNGKKECPKVYLLAPPESSGESVTLTCYVKDFYPKEVAVSWLVNDEQVDDEGGYEQNTTRVIERGNLFSVYSQLIVKTAEWKSGAVYSCRVYHESIEDPVRLISRSITITSNPPTLVNLSLNVPQTCHTFYCLMLTELFHHEAEMMDDDSMANTALTFVFLFLITLFYSIGVTVIKFLAQRVAEPRITISIKTTDKDVDLLCWLDGFHPKKIDVQWYKGDQVLRQGETIKIFEDVSTGEKVYSTMSQIRINAQQWNEGTVFACKATHNSKTFSETWSKCQAAPTSTPQIRLEKPRLMSVLTDSQVTASCVVETEYTITKVSWLVDGKPKTGTAISTRLGETVSNLTISTEEWKNSGTIKCTAEHLCFGKVEKMIDIIEPVKKTPTVEIRRILADIPKGHSAVLECVGRDLPSGELSVTFQANETMFPDVQYVDLPKGLDTVTVRFTVPKTHQTKDKRFTCQIQQSHSMQWKSNSTGKLFDDPSVELSAVSSIDKSRSMTKKLICFGTGFNPKIKWLPESLNNPPYEATMQADGRVKVSSEISVPQQEWSNGVEFKCEVSDQDHPKPVQKSTSVCTAHSNSKPQIRLEKPHLMSVLTDSQVTASCVVETEYNTKVSWLVHGKRKTGTAISTRLGETVSNLTISTEEWKNLQTIKCTAEHLCFDKVEKTFNIIEPVKKTPTVEIRRILADILKGHSAVLECVGRDLPSGELSVTFQANEETFPDVQYVDLPKGLDTLIVRVTVPKTHQTKDKHFTCQIQQSHSMQWKSNSTGKLFGDPSVELSVVSSVAQSASTTQKLLCSGTGLNPEIKWLPESVGNTQRKVIVEGDGRVKMSSELSVPQQEWNSGVKFTCQVSDQDPLKPAEKSTDVCAVTPAFAQTAQVFLLAPSISDMRANDQVSVTCLLVGHRLKDFSIIWKVGKDSSSHGVTTHSPKAHSNGTESLQSVQKVPAAMWNAYTSVSCEVKHLCSNKTQQHIISKTREVKSPTIRIFIPSDDDLSGFHNTSLLCLIDGFHPADISVHWELNGKRLDASRFTNSPVGIRSAWGGYSMHSALILLASKREDGNFSCVVSHESSKELIISTIDNIYASVNECPPSVELLQGQDELVCLVYGYSPSAINITWLQNSVSVQHEHRTSSSAKGSDGKFSIKSHLTVKASEWAPGATYTCHVEHITGVVTRSISKTEFIEKTIYFDENKSDASTLDQAEETWNMACAFIILFIISLLYGCSVTLVKV